MSDAAQTDDLWGVMMIPIAKNMTTSLIKSTGVGFIIALQLFTPIAEARGGACGSNSLRSSMYFVPREQDYSSRARFQSEVKMQGTGVMRDGRVLRYNGAIQRLPRGCQTAVGAAGRCLTPFFSVAADPRLYRMGDVVYVPEMAGRRIQLPAPKNTVITHPGYFIVDDTGSAIKGPKRFDFFTGSMGMRNPQNAFGIRASQRGQSNLSMSDPNRCEKTFRVIRQGSDEWHTAYAAINNSYNGMTPAGPSGQIAQRTGGRN